MLSSKETLLSLSSCGRRGFSFRGHLVPGSKATSCHEDVTARAFLQRRPVSKQMVCDVTQMSYNTFIIIIIFYQLSSVLRRKKSRGPPALFSSAGKALSRLFLGCLTFEEVWPSTSFQKKKIANQDSIILVHNEKKFYNGFCNSLGETLGMALGIAGIRSSTEPPSGPQTSS